MSSSNVEDETEEMTQYSETEDHQEQINWFSYTEKCQFTSRIVLFVL